MQDYENSQLEKWLRARGMTTNRFCKLIGCSRTIAWRVKRGIAISPKYAERIMELTGGSVLVNIQPIGRKKE